MKHYLVMDLEEKTVIINSIEVKINLKAFCYYDECFSIYWDMPEEQRNELIQKIDRGFLTPTVIEVKAYSDDCELGFDVLGGVLVGSEQDIKDAIADHGMLENATSNLIQSTISSANKLYKFVS